MAYTHHIPMLYKDLINHETTCPFCSPSEHTQHAVVITKIACLSLAQAPYTEDHLLITPIRHVTQLSELSNDEKDEFWKLIDIGTKLLYTKGYTGVSILLRDGNNVGKTEAHIHAHLLPNTVLTSTGSTFDRAVLDRESYQQHTNVLQSLL